MACARGGRREPSPRMARPRPSRRPGAPPSSRAEREAPLDAASWAMGALFLVAYAALASPVAGDKDSGEFVLVLATGGLAHPTGYPLYTLLGTAFVHAAHALGASWAQAANLWSALAGAVAMGGLHAVTARLLLASCGARAAAALAALPLLAFGLNPLWTMETTLAEVNALHLAWIVLAALVARRALVAVAARDVTPRTVRRHAVAWGLVVGAGLAHHVTSVLFAGPLTLVLVRALARRGRAGTGSTLAFGLAAALVPLLAYAWVAWRAWHPVPGQWAELGPSLSGVLDHVTGAQYRQHLGRYAPGPEQQAFLASFVYPWLVPAGLGALGAILLRVPAERAWRVGLGLGVVAQGGYSFLYGVRDPSSYFMPALAVGLALFVGGIATWAPARRHGAGLALVAALALVAPAIGGWQLAQARVRAYTGLEALLRQMWAGLPPGPALVVWDDDMAARLRAFQLLDRVRPDVEVVQPRRLANPEPRRRFRAAHGFDPAAGVSFAQVAVAARDEAASPALVDSIVATINRESPLPVIVFLPQGPSLRLLRKPGDPPAN